MNSLQIAIAVCFCLIGSPALARQFIVNSTADKLDLTPGDGVCSTGAVLASGEEECTIRAAVQEGNEAGGASIRVPAGTFELTRGDLSAADEERRQIHEPAFEARTAARDHDLDLAGHFSIVGAGPGLTIIGGASADRVFDIWNAVTTVSLQQMSIVRGFTAAPGGCIHVRDSLTRTLLLADVRIQGCVANSSVGGGIYNGSTLEVSRAVIRDNIAARGAGIENNFFLTVRDSTIVDNATQVGDHGASTGGGGIANFRRLLIFDSTISSNFSATYGGGVVNQGDARLTNVTVSGNYPDGIAFFDRLGGGSGALRLHLESVTIADQPGSGLRRGTKESLSLTSTLLARNSPNCVGGVSSSFHSLDSGTSCGLVGTGDLVATDPLLGPLADNGGPTQTHALIVGSPAIDAGAGTSPRDQRGVPRRIGARSDIGAYEFGASPDDLGISVPIRWSDLFRSPLPLGSSAYAVDFALVAHESARRAGASITGIKSSQQGLSVTIAPDGRSISVAGLTPPLLPNDNPGAQSPPLFFLELQRGVQRPDLLLRSSEWCACEGKPAPPKVAVVEPYKSK